MGTVYRKRELVVFALLTIIYFAHYSHLQIRTMETAIAATMLIGISLLGIIFSIKSSWAYAPFEKERNEPNIGKLFWKFIRPSSIYLSFNFLMMYYGFGFYLIHDSNSWAHPLQIILFGLIVGCVIGSTTFIGMALYSDYRLRCIDPKLSLLPVG